MLEILTPMNKIERVSRKVDPDTFTATPGIWGQIDASGVLTNIVASTPGTVTKLVINSASSSQYESNDIEVGRIATMESFGVRVEVDSEGFTGTPALGCNLAVSDDEDTLGKLFNIDTTAPGDETGTYEVVARCEEYNATTGRLIYRTMSPVTQDAV